MNTFDIEEFRRGLIASGKAMERSLTANEMQEIRDYWVTYPDTNSEDIRKTFAKKFGLVSITETGLSKIFFCQPSVDLPHPDQEP